MPKKNKRVFLITGGAGFIGSNFVRYLYKTRDDIHVRVLDKLTYAGNLSNLNDFSKRKDFEFIKGDICNPKIVKKAMTGVDVVVNFAAESAVDRSIDRPQAFLDTDIIGVYVLLEEAKKQKSLKRFVQISTDEVYGEVLQGSLTENAPLNPRNPYSASKAGGDRLAYSYSVTYGLPVIVSRCSNNYGPWCYPEKIIPLFITNLIDGQKVPVYGEGKQIRDWLYVEDHCRAISFLIENGKNGEVYNIGGVAECSNLALTQKILSLMNKDDSCLHFVQDRPGHDFRYSLDCSKLKQLGWLPQFDIDTGLRMTMEWYQDHEHWWRPLKKKMDQRYIHGFWGKKK